MESFNGNYVDIAQRDIFVLCNFVDLHCRCSWVTVFICKNVVKTFSQGIKDPGMCINRDIPLSKEKGANIINARCMIGMFVGKQNAIQFIYGIGEHLLSKIRAAINNIIVVFPRNQYGYTESLVLGVRAQANRVVTSNNGNSL